MKIISKPGNSPPNTNMDEMADWKDENYEWFVELKKKILIKFKNISIPDVYLKI